ncbi:MAG TPA: hypothetical protein VJI46_04890 [Candidatus Nanoarchaeia archaeon]|nr:hypothetical protein [Candidatus Nanoarchaeia archaeon]
MKKLLAFLTALIALESVHAHCPLCTVGAAAAAGGAAYLGVSNVVIGIFIGAFAVSMGWWVSRLIKRQFVRFQMPLIILLSFATTVIPMMPLIKGYYPLYVSVIGDYGGIYLINLFLAGSFAGGFIVSITPWLSKKIGDLRGNMLPYQGIVLTFLMLILTSAAVEAARYFSG